MYIYGTDELKFIYQQKRFGECVALDLNLFDSGICVLDGDFNEMNTYNNVSVFYIGIDSTTTRK